MKATYCLGIVFMIPFFLKAQLSSTSIDPRVNIALEKIKALDTQLNKLNSMGSQKLQKIENDLISQLKDIASNTYKGTQEIEALSKALLLAIKNLLLGKEDRKGKIPEIVDMLNKIKEELEEIKIKTTKNTEEQNTPKFLFDELERLLTSLSQRQNKIENDLEKIDLTNQELGEMIKKNKSIKESDPKNQELEKTKTSIEEIKEKNNSIKKFISSITKWIEKKKVHLDKKEEYPVPINFTTFLYNIIEKKAISLNDIESTLKAYDKDEGKKKGENSIMDEIYKKEEIKS